MASLNPPVTVNEVCNVMYKGVQVKCVVGDIISCTLGGIAVSCNSTFGLSVGVGRVVRNAGGLEFVANLNIAKNAQTGDAIDVDAAGKLKVRKVILVALKSSHRQSMQNVYLQIFDKAVNAGLDSLAIPALGTGVYGLSSTKVANFIKIALQECHTFGTLKTIQFMDLSPSRMNAFSNAIRTLLPSLSDASVVNLSSSSTSTSSYSVLSSTSSSSSDSLSGSASLLLSSSSTSSTSTASSSSSTEVSPPKRARVEINDSEYFENISQEQLVKYKLEMEKSPSNNSFTQLPCSICLGDLVSEDSFVSESLTKVIEEVVRLTVCKHMFHKDCIESAFKVKKQCPNCMRWYSAAIGDQPANATMRVREIAGTVPGHPEGTSRVAYLPDNVEGRVTLKMLQLAFEHRLIFTIGDSVTTGQKNVVVWNGIHHKTSMVGGSSNYGYPDDDYLRRVQEELGAVGIFKEMLD